MASYTRVVSTGFRSAMKFSKRVQYNKSSLDLANVIRISVRSSSTSYVNLDLPSFKFAPSEVAKRITDFKIQEKTLNIIFEDKSTETFPFLWLKDNCQCPACFSSNALARTFLLQDLDINIRPRDVCIEGNKIQITWTDGHRSTFESKWLHQRALNTKARELYTNFYRLKKISWGKDLNLDHFDYKTLMTDKEALLKYLVAIETKGAALVKSTPNDPDAGSQLIDHIAFVKMSHYGRRSSVLVRDIPNNLAFSNAKLGLHTDMAYYDYQGGIIFLQVVKQHPNTGGESIISDGQFALEYIKKHHPKALEILSKTNLYFWDKGTGNHPMEKENFYKINKSPVIELDNEGQLKKLRYNNIVRDSHMDLSPEEIISLYEALKIFNDVLYDNSFNFKMVDGDIITLDNVRCVHGREGFDPRSPRHLEASFLDWDEALCKRRRLMEELDLI